METFTIDFETYYDKNISITQQGTHNYLRHPDCDIYLVSVVNDNFKWVGHPEEFNWDILKGAALVAHNMAFDGSVLKLLQERGLVPREVGSGGLHCSADLAAYHQLPRNLAGACAVALGDNLPVDKTMRNYASGRYWKDMPAEAKAKMKEYALRDSEAAWNLWKKLSPAWPDAEQKVSRHTREQMWRGIRVDTDTLNAHLEDLKRQKWDAENEIPWAEDAPILSRKAFDAECRRHNLTPPPSLAKGDPAADKWVEQHAAQYPWVAAVSKWRRTNTLLQKLQAISDRVRDDGRMDVELKYFGAAATGRWSGAGGVNMQNLPRGDMFGVDIRHLFLPAPGKKFIISDLNAIEPRCTAYITKDAALLDLLRSGEDVYQAYARLNLGFTGADLKKEDPNLRNMAKVALLSSAYGTGWRKLKETAGSVYGLDITEQQAVNMVNNYRRDNNRVTRLWHAMEKLLERAEADARLKKLENVAEITLPSGRVIRFFDVSRVGGLTAATTKSDKKRGYWYGAKVFQNTVQATARDVMRDCINRVAEHLDTVLHVHDEIVVEADPDVDRRELADLMSVPPEWAPDLPVAAEAEDHTCYTK